MNVDQELYDSYLEEAYEILKKSPNQENMTWMTGKVIEHRMADKFCAEVRNTKGSDAIVTDDNYVQTLAHELELLVNDLLEIKGTVTVMRDGKTMRVASVLSKKDKMDYMVIHDGRKGVERTFVIPHDVFFARARIGDINYTKSISWNADYNPSGVNAVNTLLLLEYEVQ